MTARKILIQSLQWFAGISRRALYGAQPERPRTAKDIAYEQWVAAKGDTTLRMNYPLNAQSVVLDVGGYEGQWASDMFARYCCTIHLFEPVPVFVEGLTSRFSANPHIHIYPFALGAEDGELDISVDADASSLHIAGQHKVRIQMRKFGSWLNAADVKDIDLVKINIEGGEYDLLSHLIESGFVNRIRDIQVQFHDFVPSAERRMREIASLLSHTHRLTYQFPFIWENWTRKDN